MFFSALFLLSLFSGWGLFGSVSGSPAVEEAYKDVVSVVSPGQQALTGESLRSVFNTLEKRVQCGGVSCEKVSFIRLTPRAGNRARCRAAGSVEGGQGTKAIKQPCLLTQRPHSLTHL